ncbi:ATP-binding protein [Streptomyces kronopolitis]|uniref:ATP-binding protein n=1 Tax=Streptomyces kronopolitis TaxID=1612435 RepID=UPI003D971DE7
MLESPPPTIWRVTLPRGETAVPVARAMVRTALQDLQVTADRTTAELLTGELVSNALKHTCGTHPIGLVVERAKQGCRIEVHDSDPMLIDDLLDGPAPAPGTPDEAGAAGAPETEADEAEPVDAAAAVAAGGTGPVEARAAVAADGSGQAPRGAAAGAQRAADDRVPGQRAGGTGISDEAGDGTEVGNGEGNEVGDDAGERTGAGALTTEARAPGTSFIDAAAAAEAAEAAARDAHGHGEQGRGLLLLRSLSSDAGCRPTACGKAVWFTLPDLPHRRPR